MNTWLNIFTVSLLFTLPLTAQKQRVPITHEPGLLMANNVVALSQSDFDSGTYRITESGYYYFTEDVSFEPIFTAEATRTDKPRTAWFAGMSIECDNVIIDLNTKTFECSEDFVNSHDFKVFAMIELNNSPFPHLTFAFTGETELKTAHNVIIKNGTLGRSSHHGIHGNGNSHVQVYDLVVKDWEVAGIGLNGLQSGTIKNVNISGVEHTIPFTGFLAVLQSAREVLEDLIASGDTEAQAHINALDIIINDDTKNGKNHPHGTHDGNTYGLFINRTVDVGPIVTHCDKTTANAILIENVTVSNISTGIFETVAIGDNNGKPLKGDLFGTLRWADAYPNGSFTPNAVLKAQVYGVHKNNPSKYPAGFSANILSNSPNESTFLSHVRPLFNRDFAGHTNKGAFGIRVDCGHGIMIQSCHVQGIENIGEKGNTLDTLTGGSNYDFKVGRYTGNDAYGISLSACHNCKIIDCEVVECSSKNGFVHGITIMNNADANYVHNCISSDHFANLSDTNSSVNPSSIIYGFFVNNESNSNRLVDCVSQSLESPRYCYGYWVANTTDTVLDHCTSSYHKVTSGSKLTKEKEVAGFVSNSSETTLFKGCEARQMRCTNESSHSGSSKSRAVGFLFEEGNTLSEITECVALCNNGGAGTAVGVLLDTATRTTVIKNESANNHGDTSAAKGYGFQDTATETSSLFLKNVAYGNTTLNYDITFPSGQSLPLTAALYGNIANLYLANEWNNISLESAGGQHYTGDTVETRTIIRQVITG